MEYFFNIKRKKGLKSAVFVKLFCYCDSIFGLDVYACLVILDNKSVLTGKEDMLLRGILCR